MSHSVFSAHVINRHVFKFNDWILDIGAIDHMVHSVSQLTTFTSIMQSCVFLPNREHALVTHIGTMQISPTLMIIDVLCVPTFSFNLISVSKLTKLSSCCLIFLGNWCFIQDLAQWRMIGLGKECRELYLLQAPTSHTTLATSASHSSSNLWHSRLGHPSFSKLVLLNKLVGSNFSNKLDCYEFCHFSNQKRIPFSSSRHVSSLLFELIHCDLWGRFATCTIKGFEYFLTIVDDFSCCTWVYLLKNKFDTQFLILDFVNMVHT